MTISVQHPTAGKKTLTLRGIRLSGVNHDIVSGRITHPTLGDKQFWDGSSPPTPTATAAPTTVSGAVTGHAGTKAVTTASATVSVTGGSAPYAYAWALTDDDSLGGTWAATSPSSATTAFNATAVPVGGRSEATFTCTVTDARGATTTVAVVADAFVYPV